MRFLRYSVIFLRFIIYMSSYWVHDLKSFVGQCNIRLIYDFVYLGDSLAYQVPIAHTDIYFASHQKWQCFTVMKDQRIVETRRRRDTYNHMYM